jgi:hypothetical protein
MAKLDYKDIDMTIMRYSANIVLFMLVFLSIPLQAETIKVESITFQSQDSSLIKKYLDTRVKSQAADKYYASIREGYTKKTATIEDYKKAQEDFAEASKKMLALESELELVPTILKGEPNKWSKEEMRQQWTEARKVRDRLPLIKENLHDVNAYEKRLQNMLSRFRGHAAESSILNSLGELSENSPKKAIKYYEEATKCSVRSDEWDFEQQSTWQKLAEMHEKNKEYKEAVKALQNWKISEPCGNGANSSYIKRSFKIWELKLHYESQEQVFKELWQELSSENITYAFGDSLDGLAQQVRILYGQTRLALLKGTVDELRLHHPEINDIVNKGYYFSHLFTELAAQIQLIEQIRGASLQETLEILSSVRSKKGAPHIEGSLIKLNVHSKDICTEFWREEMLITRLLSFPPGESVPALIVSNSKYHEPCKLFVIGKIGGKDAVQYLLQKAETEENVWGLRDYHFCLLLTGDKDALAFVQDAAIHGSGNNPAAAEWALSNR